ncbi:MAG: DUF1631 family protein [Methylococcales bacterium]|nr:DUF1631 family protein [Methylococcales bacterium]
MSNSKRRRYTRYEINLDAILIANNANFIPCVIRDFCSGGMFIELVQSNSVQALKQGQKVHVQFGVGIGFEEKKFSLNAQIMHIKSIGLGVAFEESMEEAFNVLKKQVQRNVGLSSTNKWDTPENLEKQERLEADLTSLMQEELPIILKQFYQHVNFKLTETSEQAGSYQYQVILTEAKTNLKISKDAVYEKFCSISGKDSNILSVSHFDEIDETQEQSGLSLIEKNDFEDWLDFSTIIRSLDASYETELKSLQDKMAYILDIDKSLLFNPLSPEKLCDRFRDTVATIEENDQTRRCLYILFEETLRNYLNKLYGRMDVILLAHGAPEKVEGKSRDFKKINPGTKSITDYHSSKPEDASIIQKTEEVNVVNPDPVKEGELLPTVQPQISEHESHQIVNVASNLIGLLNEQRSSSPHQAQIETAVETPQEVYSTKEINAALTYLQQHAVQSGIQQSFPNNLQKELQSALSHSSSLQKQLSNSDKLSLDVYESLFDILFNDQMVTEQSLSYLRSIQIPIMAQALQDNSFLESEDNPIRNIVNHLFWLGAIIKNDSTEKSDQIKQTLDHLMSKISDESLANPVVFSSVEQKLEEITESVNKSVASNIKRITEVYEGKQKLGKAREFVQKEINHLFSGKQTPHIIITLLDAGWQHLLVIDKLHEDKNAFQNHLGIINSLFNWVTKSKKPRLEVSTNVLDFVNTQLQNVCTNTFLHKKILKDLNDILLMNKLLPNSDAMKMVLFEIDSNTRDVKQETPYFDEVNRLKVGEWLMFLMDKEFEALKLVWVSENHKLFVFVDQRGVNKLEMECDKLAGLIRKGIANKIESLDVPIMDRATNMMLQKLQQKFIYNATRDLVTDVYNRKEFFKQLKLKLTSLEKAKYLLCNIEVQDFRIITNACGLSGGDALLKQIANILKRLLRKEDIFARLDDKTFSVLLKNCNAEVVKRIQTELICNEFSWEDKSYAIAVGMGVVPLFSGNSYEVNSVLQKADSATLVAINTGRNRIRVYKDDDESLKSQYNAHEWVGRINKVFSEKRLFLRCQKIAAISPEKDSHTHYEILLGITDEKGNTIAPDDFIPAVERCQRMSEVDQWVVLNVFDWIEKHQEAFKELDGFSINLSGESMNSEDFLAFLNDTLSSSSVPLDKITFEITETVAADSFEFVQTFIKKIKRFKCKFSLDDFGSGYSSYSYLKSLDVDYLKIDGIFVKDIVNNSTDVAIVKSMNEIGHSLNMKTIAEYVENDEIHEMLKEIGVDYAQGFGVEKPKRITELA